MTTTANVIHDDITPLVLTTKFDVDYDYGADGKTASTEVLFASIIAKVAVSQGNSAFEFDFSLHGDPSQDYYDTEFQESYIAISSVINAFEHALEHLKLEHRALRVGAIEA